MWRAIPPYGAYLPHKYWAFVPGRYLALRTTPSSSTVNGNFGPIFTNLLPLGRWGCHSVWVRFLATVGRVETSIIKTPLSLPVVPLRMDPSLIHPASPESRLLPHAPSDIRVGAQSRRTEGQYHPSRCARGLESTDNLQAHTSGSPTPGRCQQTTVPRGALDSRRHTLSRGYYISSQRPMHT